jgi:phosphoglycolate phosphatase
MSHLFLFDIDLTLIRTRGVGAAAMNAVLAEMIGVENAFAGLEFSGRTDRAIIRNALRNHDRELDGDNYEAFLAEFERRYVPLLREHLHERGGHLLPGVRETLESVRALPDVRVGITTGNFRRAADVKLAYFGLDHYFSDGGYADDAEDRAELVAIAIRRLGGAAAGHGVFVIGDTSYDVNAALANGAVAVGVATGGSTVEMLAAAGAHHVVDDLSRPDDLLRRLLGSD